MAVTKIRKISSWTLLAVMIVSIVALAMFYMGGVTEFSTPEKKDPVNTDLLLYWCYAIFVISVICLFFFGLLQFISSLKAKPKAALMSFAVLIVFAGLLGVTYGMGDATPLPGINVDSARFNVTSWLKISDMWIYSTYILLVLCILAMVAGSIKKVLNK